MQNVYLEILNQPSLMNLHSNKYIQGLRHYPFAVNLDRCIGSCNTVGWSVQ